MLLEIDTTGKEVRIYLYDQIGNLISSVNQPIIHNHTEELLSSIESLLQEAGKEKSDLSAIKVNPGPGPFTAVRCGVTVANTLAFGLDIPVFAQMLDPRTDKFEKPVLPIYAFAPKISQPKN